MCVECADRELLPSFHEVSVYPKKELPFFILFTAGLCSFTALLALLTHQYPDSMGVSQLKRLFFHTYLTMTEIDFTGDKPVRNCRNMSFEIGAAVCTNKKK
jgi:hypothetical protein